ncbi:MAG: hypothetical protein ACJAZK_001594 [Psychroserpens sp.]|uniref:hypothetical protein n=1 Tax=Psychroserpens sp. TaxID=2020870 RepID=UPI0039E4661F
MINRFVTTDSKFDYGNQGSDLKSLLGYDNIDDMVSTEAQYYIFDFINTLVLYLTLDVSPFFQKSYIFGKFKGIIEDLPMANTIIKLLFYFMISRVSFYDSLTQYSGYLTGS